MTTPVIAYNDFLSRVPDANNLVFLGMTELAAKGMNHPGNFVSYNWKVLYAKIDYKVVGVIAFEFQELSNSYWICMSYVLPDYRRLGVHSALWKGLIDHCKQEKVERVYTSISIKNSSMLDVAKSQGRVPTSVNYVYELEKS